MYSFCLCSPQNVLPEVNQLYRDFSVNTISMLYLPQSILVLKISGDQELSMDRAPGKQALYCKRGKTVLFQIVIFKMKM